MNSRWPEYDHFYHNEAIHSQVAHLDLAAKVKCSSKEGKGKVRFLGGWLVTITRFAYVFIKYNRRNRANQNLVD